MGKQFKVKTYDYFEDKGNVLWDVMYFDSKEVADRVAAWWNKSLEGRTSKVEEWVTEER